MCEFRSGIMPADKISATANDQPVQSPAATWSPLSRGNITLLWWVRQAPMLSGSAALGSAATRARSQPSVLADPLSLEDYKQVEGTAFKVRLRTEQLPLLAQSSSDWEFPKKPYHF